MAKITLDWPSRKNQILVGDSLSTFGAWLDMIAILTIAAYTFSVSPYQMALISAAGLLPGILLSKYIGKLFDNFSPVSIVKLSLMLRVLATLLIFFSDNLIWFSIAVACRSVFSSCTLPAINSLARYNVSSVDRSAYLSTLSLINGICKISAPVLGGVLSEVWSPYCPLIVSCILGLLAMPFFSSHLSIISEFSEPPSPGEPLLAVRKVASESVFFSCLAIYFSFVFMVNNLLPLVLRSLNHDASMLGMLMGASGAGNLLASVYLLKKVRTEDSHRDIQSMLRPALGTAACFMLIGFMIEGVDALGEFLLIVSFLIIGMFSASFSIATNHHLFRIFVDRIGVATAHLQAVQNSAILLAPLLGAFVLDHSSPKALFIFSSTAALLGLSALYLATLGRKKTVVEVKY